MAFNQQFVRNLLILILAFVIVRTMVINWKNFKEKRAVARVEYQARNIDIIQREKQAIKLMQIFITSAQANITRLQIYADEQPSTVQSALYTQINDLSQELYDIKEKFQRKQTPSLFLLGPLSAPVQTVKDRILKKRLLMFDQKINKLIN
ncbi:hypothetical protein A3F06_00990 [candidate division TM6 bacterium RIFCSPHIGHO2_12_FULL_36_22]|nr:MAG: hypothetical protein A3F06_00990 [candidate division TM6 bacterium RIFCSPHIGHO2_12_FULL_36_22]